jgi:excisionase family DNA binding protein
MSTESIVPYRVYTPAEAAELLRLPVDVVQAAVRQGDLAALQAGGDCRILGQGLINYVLAGRLDELPRPDHKATLPDRPESQLRSPAERAQNVYDITTARGGKDDWSIERALAGKWETLGRGDEVTVQPESMNRSHWNGADRVEIEHGFINFPKRKDHTLVPVAIKAAARVLYRNNVRGSFEIGAWDRDLTIRPLK